MISNATVSTLFVSQKRGSDAYSGFEREEKGFYQGPLKTIEAALERIKNMRAVGSCHPVRIVLTDDIYVVTKPIVVANAVSQVTICSDCNTVVSGGLQVEGFRKDTFNGKPCFSAHVPQVEQGMWFTDLFVDGRRADYTSFPKEGFYAAQEVENKADVYDAESRWFIPFPEDREVFKHLRNFDDCFVSFNHFWMDEHTPIDCFEEDTGKIWMKYLSRFSIHHENSCAKMRWKLENAAEAFELPNQWYLDRPTAMLYYIPADESQTPESIRAYLAVAKQLFVVQGEKDQKVNYITLRDLTFSHTGSDYASRYGTDTHVLIPEDHPGYACDEQGMCNAYGAVEFRYAHGCAVERCLFTCLGLHGITLEEGSDHIRIYGNRFYRLGGGAVKINGGAYGCEKSEETWGNTVSQNHITHCGQRYAASVGVMIMHAYGNTVSHNEIGWLYYTGISVGWVWGYDNNITKENLIEYNHVHHIGQGVLSDMGAIYLLGVQPGTVVRGNIVHDVQGCGYGGTGIYTDEGSAQILIENNIVYNIHSSAYNHHYGRMNTVRNNIFCKASRMVQASRPELHTGLVMERNIMVSEGKYAYGYGYQQEGPCCGNLNMIAGDHNLHFDVTGDPCLIDLDGKRLTLSEAQEVFGLEFGSQYADPLFVDYENNDFTLKENSPAFALGFEPIDTSNVGVTIKG